MTKTLVGLDLETTHATPGLAEIIQIGAVMSSPDTWDMEVLFNQKSRPKSGEISHEATAIHGVAMEHLKYAPMDIMSVTSFTSLVHLGLKNVVLVTYNGEHYDLPILRRYGASLNFPHIDVFRIVQRTEGLFKHGLKLSEVHNGALGEPLEGAHDAIPDIIGTLNILRWFMETNNLSLEGVTEWINTPRVLDVCYFGKHARKPFSEVPTGYLRWVKDNWDTLSPDMALTLERYL